MAVLALYQPDPRSRARLLDALRGDHRVLSCQAWGRVRKLAREGCLDGCIVDPYGTSEGMDVSDLRGFRRRYHQLAIVIFADFRGRELDLYDLGRMGVDGVILSRDENSHRGIRGVVDQALSASLARRVEERLEGRVPALGLRCISWAVERAGECPQVSDLADHLRTSPRALTRELRGMGLPSPRQILLWGRILQAARMLGAPDTTVEDAAFHLGYATGASLGRALKDQAGFSPTELQEAGGVDAVLDIFLESVLEGVRNEDARQGWSTAGVRREVLGSLLGR